MSTTNYENLSSEQLLDLISRGDINVQKLLKRISDLVDNSPRIKYYDQIEVGFLKIYKHPLVLLGRLMTIWRIKRYTFKDLMVMGTVDKKKTYITIPDTIIRIYKNFSTPPVTEYNLGWGDITLKKDIVSDVDETIRIPIVDGDMCYSADIYANGTSLYFNFSCNKEIMYSIYDNYSTIPFTTFGDLNDGELLDLYKKSPKLREVICKGVCRRLDMEILYVPEEEIAEEDIWQYRELRWYALLTPFLYLWEKSGSVNDKIQYSERTTYSTSEDKNYSGTISGILSYKKLYDYSAYYNNSDHKYYNDNIGQYIHKGIYTPSNENTRFLLKIEFAKPDKYHQQFILEN